MTALMLGWVNRARGGVLTASAAAPGLGPDQVANDQGATSTAWQTPAGTTAAWLRLDAGASAAWRALSVHRTNLTAAATLRWRLSVLADGVADATALPHDSLAGATLGPNTTRVGTTGDPLGGAAAVTYSSSSSSNSFVRASNTYAVLAGGNYRVTVWARRISGAGTVGQIIRAVPPAGPVGVVQIAGNLTASWQQFSVTFTPTSAGSATISFFFGAEAATGEVAFFLGAVEPVPAYDSGVLPGTVAAGYGQSVHIAPAAVTARYLRLDVADSGNPQGFLNIPLLFAGPVWQPAHQWSPDSAEGAQAEIAAPVTRGGQEWPELRWRKRRRVVSLPLVPRADRWPQLGEMERQAATGANILVVPSPTGDLLREPIFGPVAFDGVGYAGAAAHRFRTTRFTVTERL
jgi:hypothetical protein